MTLAERLVADIDVNDISYIALAIELKCKLWTGDFRLVNGLRKKGFKNFITTDQVLKLVA